MKNKAKRIIIGITIILSIVAIGITASLTVFSAGSRLEYAIVKANKYVEDGNYQEAILEFNKAIAIDDKRADVWLGKLAIQVEIEDNTGAIETLTKFTAQPESYYSDLSIQKNK